MLKAFEIVGTEIHRNERARERESKVHTHIFGSEKKIVFSCDWTRELAWKKEWCWLYSWGWNVLAVVEHFGMRFSLHIHSIATCRTFYRFHSFSFFFRFHPNWSLYTLCVYVFFIVKSRSSCRLSVIRVLFICTLSVCAYLFAFSVKYHPKCHFYTGILFFRVDNVSLCAFRMWEGRQWLELFFFGLGIIAEIEAFHEVIQCE